MHDVLAHVHDSLHNLVLLVPLVAFMLSPPVALLPRGRTEGQELVRWGRWESGGRAYAPAMGVQQGAGRRRALGQWEPRGKGDDGQQSSGDAMRYN